jgi:hypothetical protein
MANDERRSELDLAYERLWKDVSAALFRLDPFGLTFETNTHEYDMEARSIVRRLRDAVDVAEVQRIVHDEFVRASDTVDAGPPGRYAAVASEIWAIFGSSAVSSARRPADGVT